MCRSNRCQSHPFRPGGSVVPLAGRGPLRRLGRAVLEPLLLRRLPPARERPVGAALPAELAAPAAARDLVLCSAGHGAHRAGGGFYLGLRAEAHVGPRRRPGGSVLRFRLHLCFLARLPDRRRHVDDPAAVLGPRFPPLGGAGGGDGPGASGRPARDFPGRVAGARDVFSFPAAIPPRGVAGCHCPAGRRALRCSPVAGIAPIPEVERRGAAPG